jgi:23S rRNA (cytidine2498-2'-O)-methyltransferase
MNEYPRAMASELRIHLCRPERTAALQDELAQVFPASRHTSSIEGVVQSELTDADAHVIPALAFARQVLPACQVLRAASINALAAETGARLAATARGWRLHAFALAGASGGRARLIAEALDGWLGKHHRALRRTRSLQESAPLQPDETLVQLALAAPDQLILSLGTPELRARLRRVLSAQPEGAIEVPRDPRPPSRAYAKLVEAQLRMGRSIGAGETVVDLGASPGGWSFIALDRGARVFAIDRAPLRDDLMANPRCTFIQGDAFAWHPERPVDWLVCDLIAFPERTLLLLEDWLGQRRCTRYVVTVKFRGDEDYARIHALRALLERIGGEFLLRQLDANKNEITAMGTLPA